MVNKLLNMRCSRDISTEIQIKIAVPVIAQWKVSFLSKRSKILTVSSLAHLMNCLHRGCVVLVLLKQNKQALGSRLPRNSRTAFWLVWDYSNMVFSYIQVPGELHQWASFLEGPELSRLPLFIPSFSWLPMSLSLPIIFTVRMHLAHYENCTNQYLYLLEKSIVLKPMTNLKEQMKVSKLALEIQT